MPDYKKLFDPSDYLFAYDLDGRDVVVTIDHVEAGVLTGTCGKTTKKPVAFLVGTPKRLALNKTNCKTLVALTGSRNTDDWAGAAITIYPTTTTMGPETVDCIRIRPTLAKVAK